jgi:LysR family transcriptional regulator, regulator of abg operon
LPAFHKSDKKRCPDYQKRYRVVADHHLTARLRFRHLQLVEEVERWGSLSGAAPALGLTQPALSKALKEIEDMLGFMVFDRGPRGLRKTAQGAIVAQGASLLLRELRHLHAEAISAGGEGKLSGILRLGTSGFLAVGFLPIVVARLGAASPPLAVQVREENVPRLFQSLLAGELDALISVYNSEVMASADRDVLFEAISEERYVVIAPPAHSLARRGPTSWEILAEASWVLTRAPSLVRGYVEDSFRRHGLMPPAPVCETDGPVTAARMVAAGVGISAVPESTARDAIQSGGVAPIELQVVLPSATLGLVYRVPWAKHPRIQMLRQALGMRERCTLADFGDTLIGKGSSQR